MLKSLRIVNQMKKITIMLLLAMLSACITTVLPFGTMVASADSTTQNHALRIVGQYKGVLTSPPTRTNTDQTTDGPLMGNGDLGVAILNNIDSMTFILHKNEFWSLGEGRVKAMARMSLSIPGMAGASYRMEQDIARAEVNGTFSLSGSTVTTKSWVQATDTTNNMLITRFTYTGSGTKNVSVSLAVGNENPYANSVGSSGDVLYIDVRADSQDTVGGYNTRKVRVATRVIGTTGTISNNKLNFTLSPGGTYTLITCIMSNYDSSNYQNLAISNINTKTQTDVDSMNSSHRTWWNNFYGKSFVEIPDKTLEKQFYASLYLLACCSRTNEAAPGLWGNWVMRNPGWNGDYTLNYNYESPFYMAFPTNHVELADCYDKAVVDWVPKAQAEASANGWTGAFYRVHIGPLPNGSSDTQVHNQKSCGAFAATDMIMRYYYTRDIAYANSVYNTLKQIATFWQNYLSWDGSRYVILNDAQHEGDQYPQTNGIMSLGLVRFLLQGVIDMSTDLNVDSSQRAIWQDRLSKLSAFPTFTRNGQTVFRYTEVGRDWNDGNAIGIQHIYPGSQIGLGSDSGLLQIARNTVSQMARWVDNNATPTFYPAAARVGHDPNAILNNLRSWVTSHTYPNLHTHAGGGGIENLNTVPAAICEMLMQSFQHKIRVFANWPSGVDAKFGDLRAYGAFLVSSEKKSNAVRYMRVISEKGRSFTFVNPWPGQTLRIYRNGSDAGTLSGSEITIPTSVNETIHIAPNGTSYSSILSMMDQPLSSTSSGEVVTASSEYPTDGRYATCARDGDESTFWSSRMWTSPTDYQWLQVDFGTSVNISRWVVRHMGGVDNTRNFKLQRSSDGANWIDVDVVTGNTADVTDRNVASFNARYVRVYITVPQQSATQWARIREFQVYGGGVTSGATFYQDINYGGTAVTLAPGNYTLSQLTAAGIPNDSVSSIKVQSGLTVEIYEHDNFEGAKWTFTSDDPTLVDNGCNDMMSSVKIISGGGGGVPIGKTVSLRCVSNNKYVCSENGGSNMNCNRDSAGVWERFLVVDAGGGKIALKGHAGDVPANKYVCSENGQVAMVCNRDAIGEWEKFDWIDNGDGTFSLRGSNGRYVTGSSPMWCNATSIGSAEKFQVTVY